jgi:hypothetical protein
MKKCQAMIANLFRHVKTNDSSCALFNIALIMKTEKCQDVYDLKSIRNATEKKINSGDPDRMKRILEDRATDKQDMFFAKLVMHEYRGWYIHELNKIITWRSWFDYEVKNNELCSRLVCGVTTGAVLALAGYDPITVRLVGIAVAMAKDGKKS